jgi:hypothetical protein
VKSKDFIHLERRLSPSFPGFAIKGSLLFICPVENTLRGFHFEPSAFAKKEFYVGMFFLPLCVPTRHVHFTFGHRVGDEKRWSSGESGLEANLSSAMLREVPFLSDLRGPADVAKALEALTKEPNPHCHEAFAYTLIQAGEVSRAAKALETVLKLTDAAVTWQQEIASRARLIREKLLANAQEAQRQLSIWESETISNLGLERFRRAVYK